MDLERTVGIGRSFYWKKSMSGYTTKLSEAGLFTEEEADRIVGNDFDKRTIKIDKKVVDGIFK